MNTENSIQPTGIAALDCSLQGGYLIEASAGTGKTWTLTGVILRLLVEQKYPPERIVATTFTRAAAAEMQERINQRLQAFYACIRWFKSCQLTYPAWFLDDLDEHLPTITEQAKSAGVDASDPIHQHLLKVLACDERALDEAIYRTGLLLTTLDKLFVGTLDSLTQKWLKEFAAQIGYQPDAELLSGADEQTLSLIHDKIRSSEVELKNHQPKLYALIKSAGVDWIFRDAAKVKDSINEPLQFFTAPIDELDGFSSLDGMMAELGKIEGVLHDFANMDLQPFAEFMHTPIDELYDQGFNKNSSRLLLAGLSKLADLTALVRETGVFFHQYLTKEHQDLLKKVAELDEEKLEKLFKKSCDVGLKERFISLPFDEIDSLNAVMVGLERLVAGYQQSLLTQIAHIVRTRLGEVLETQHKTTFTLQMVRLTSALASNPALARHIRHHYPVALIDESQDINGLQVQLIEQVYLSPLREYQLEKKRFDEIGGDKPKSPKGFLLLVGDPKQAIYRFRGGDVANYNLVKNYGKKALGQPILNSSLVLDVNRRSNRALIDSLNIWFTDNGLAGVQNHAHLGEGICYQQIKAFEETQRLSWQNTPSTQSFVGERPVAVLHSDYAAKADLPFNVALHINSLLQSGQTLDGRPIRPSDIAVLAATKKELEAVQQSLEVLGIQAVSADDVNVFATQAGQDIYALLTAVLEPARSAVMGRWLTSPMMGLSLRQSQTVQGLTDDTQTDGMLTDGIWSGLDKLAVLTYLRVLREKWQQYGLASALNYAFTHSPLNFIQKQHKPTETSNLASENLWLVSARLGERYLADVWQLVELVGQKSLWQEQTIIAWYEKMMASDGKDVDEMYKRQTLPSETGVNLMTIHKSKGLEFPIVYVLSMDKAITEEKQSFYPYSDDDYHRRLSPVPSGEREFAKLNHAESVDERRRLGYVALTRASEQIFVVVCDGADKKGIDHKPIHQWFDHFDKELALPERLTGVVDWIKLDQLDDLIDEPYGDETAQKEPIIYPKWQQILPKTYFNGVYQTSFTALVAKLDKASQALAVMEADYYQLTQDDESEQATAISDDVRATFMRGRFAGDFLHKVLETAQTPDDLGRAIDEQVKFLGLPAQYASSGVRQYLLKTAGQADTADEHQAMIDWLSCVMRTPFLASNTALVDLPKSVQVRELGFVLGLNDTFSLEKLNEIFAKYSDKPLILDDDDAKYRYLRGEIDLVYEKVGKFFVVDYKSNHLGNLPSSYDTPSLEKAMAKAGYWLQAAIYQVAIHRLLKVRLADYQGNEERYLGAVEYVFLRGVCDDDVTLGRITWQVPIALVLALDEIF
ncbi:UvrD-helicase domain-containing protein [Moraxella nasibovis]|uniref:UvrD-helicase domain-containing protein n=1 Tax=Moraxella nasibovis TaxID=2904120 RepID=UPI00240EB4B5|nr:UvrD-helicase domain-containing protein [Moraxella nasibovis]WFF37752.1 UvrD-helicase domain-containing protein [Moraxella nasibovis]